MPDILIRGIEMPTDEPLRIFLDTNGQVFVDRGVYYDEFEAVELPEHGEWIEDRMDYKCSACCKTVKDEIIYMLEPYQFPAFCPYCGVKLETPKEETK